MASTSAINRLAAPLRDTVVGLVRRDGPDLSARQLGVLLICYLEDGWVGIVEFAKRLAADASVAPELEGRPV